MKVDKYRIRLNELYMNLDVLRRNVNVDLGEGRITKVFFAKNHEN